MDTSLSKGRIPLIIVSHLAGWILFVYVTMPLLDKRAEVASSPLFPWFFVVSYLFLIVYFYYTGGTIHIEIEVEDNILKFTCDNSIVLGMNERSHSDGIGLENIRKRLNLTYPEQHSLTTGADSLAFRRRMMQPFQGNSYTTSMRDFPSTGDYWIYVYRVNKDYVDLYERVSSTDMSNPSTSIENAFGIFTAMSVSRIRFQVIAVEE